MANLIGLVPEREYLFTYREARNRGDLFSVTPPNPYREGRVPLAERVYGPVLSWNARYGPYLDDREANEMWSNCPLTIAVVDGDGVIRPRRVMWLPIYPYHGTELSWGYIGSGPSDLALALLCDALGEWPTRDQFNHGCSLAHLWHMEFRDAFTVKGDKNIPWMLTGVTIHGWIEYQRRKYPHDERRIEVELRMRQLAEEMHSYDDREDDEANVRALQINEEMERLIEESADLYTPRQR